jgi:uncharacterized protein involved in exopolysaccharide biosynthesis
MNSNEEEAENLAASASLFDRRDREKVRNYASFLLGSVRRHRLLVVAIFVSIMGATVGSFFAFPKTYHVETKALAQPNSALTVRGDGPGGESLTRVAAETVLRRDNLLALIQQTDLVRYSREHRAPVQRARDAIVKALHGREDSQADRIDSLVEQLEKKLAVWTNETGTTVTIAIDWSDAPMACRLVDAAQRAFLDARYAQEITALAESIGILRSHTTSLKADIDDAVGGIERMRGARDAPKADVAAPMLSPRPRMLSMQRPAAPRAPGPNPELQQLKIQIDAKLHAIDELEEFRRHRLSELQAHLAEARTTYTENHPAIGDLKQSIAALSAESLQVTSLRQEAASLQAEYDRRSDSPGDAPAPANASTPAPFSLVAGAVATPPQLPSDVLRLDLDLREDRDPGMVYARGQLRDAMDKYATLRTQIQTAQVDLETAQAAFKYRYTVVTPAHLPRSPTKPNVPIVLLAALIAAMLSSLLVAVLADVRAGRLLEPWQIERLLDRPILGEIALPMLEGPDVE